MSHEHQDTRDVRTISNASVAQRIQQMRDVEAKSLRRKIASDLLSIGIGILIGASILSVVLWAVWKHL